MSLLAALMVGSGAIYFFQPDRSIDSETFRPRLLKAFESGGFEVLEITSSSAVHVPWLWKLRWKAHHSNDATQGKLVTGFPNRSERFKLKAGNASPLECDVEYLDGRAAFITIQASPAQGTVAQTLRSKLEQEFPKFQVTLGVEGG